MAYVNPLHGMTEEEKLIRWPNALRLQREIEHRTELENQAKFRGQFIPPKDYTPPPEYSHTKEKGLLKSFDLDEYGRAFEYRAGKLFKVSPYGELQPIKERFDKQSGYTTLYLTHKYGSKAENIAEHRAIWSFFNGLIPAGHVIDHKNGNRSDNRIENLRLATPQQNSFNKPSKAGKPIGLRNITKQGRFYIAQVMKSGTLYKAKCKTLEEAIEAAKELRLEHYGEFAIDYREGLTNGFTHHAKAEQQGSETA